MLAVGDVEDMALLRENRKQIVALSARHRTGHVAPSLTDNGPIKISKKSINLMGCHRHYFILAGITAFDR